MGFSAKFSVFWAIIFILLVTFLIYMAFTSEIMKLLPYNHLINIPFYIICVLIIIFSIVGIVGKIILIRCLHK